MAWFIHQHRKQMPLLSVGQLLSNTLYTRRFFPMYAFNILGGIDKKTGEGYIFGYDSIGSMERKKYRYVGVVPLSLSLSRTPLVFLDPANSS